jgi:hypothetical protein
MATVLPTAARTMTSGSRPPPEPPFQDDEPSTFRSIGEIAEHIVGSLAVRLKRQQGRMR